MVAVEVGVDGTGIGRIRLYRTPEASGRSLLACIITGAIEPGSSVVTDGWEGDQGLATCRHKDQATVIRGCGKTVFMFMSRVHRVGSWLTRWWLGTHQGGVSLRRYGTMTSTSSTGWFTRRTSRHRGTRFYRFVQSADAVQPAPFSRLVKMRQSGFTLPSCARPALRGRCGRCRGPGLSRRTGRR